MLDEFRLIAETATPQHIQSRMVTPAEARAVISSFNRLTDPLRSNFLQLPLDNIIEFSMMQTKKRPSLYSYMDGVNESVQPPEPVAIPEPEPEPIPEPQPEPEPQPVVEKAKAKPPKEPRADEKFFTHLTEKLQHLAAQPAQSIVVETTEKHVEKLLEVEQAMLVTMATLTERIEAIAAGSHDTRVGLTEVLSMHRDMMTKLSESQAQTSAVQHKLIEAQVQMAETIGVLADKIALFSLTPPIVNPVVNVPAPIVNVTTTPEGRRTKIIHRDENNLITQIDEGYED